MWSPSKTVSVARCGWRRRCRVRCWRVAIDDGHWCAKLCSTDLGISMNAHTEMLEASLFVPVDDGHWCARLCSTGLGIFQDVACFDDHRIVAVAADTDRRHRTVVVHQ